jgi:hypothetical protein
MSDWGPYNKPQEYWDKKWEWETGLPIEDKKYTVFAMILYRQFYKDDPKKRDIYFSRFMGIHRPEYREERDMWLGLAKWLKTSYDMIPTDPEIRKMFDSMPKKD